MCVCVYKQFLGVCMCKFYRFFCWVTFCFGLLLLWLFRSHEMNAQLEEITCVCAGFYLCAKSMYGGKHGQ